jgi:hypothetical protein
MFREKRTVSDISVRITKNKNTREICWIFPKNG